MSKSLEKQKKGGQEVKTTFPLSICWPVVEVKISRCEISIDG